MSEHTPGPWVANHFEDRYFEIDAAHGPQVGEAYSKEDALVMAAAPELLAELKTARELVRKWTFYQGDSQELHDKYVAPIDAVIAKAEAQD